MHYDSEYYCVPKNGPMQKKKRGGEEGEKIRTNSIRIFFYIHLF